MIQVHKARLENWHIGNLVYW